MFNIYWKEDDADLFWHIPLRSLIFATGIQNLFSAKAQGKILWGLLSVLLTAILSTKPFRFPTEYIIKCMRKERS